MARVYDRLPVFAQDMACTWAGWRRWRQRFGGSFDQRLDELERTLGASRERLLEIQRDRLVRMVSRARRHVPHYRDLDLPPPSEALEPQRAIEETLAAIPVLAKDDLRASPESFRAEDVAERRRIPWKTSGTTGTALRLWYTHEALAEEWATVWRMRRSVGCELRDPHLTFGGQLIVPFAQDRPPFWRHNYWGRQTLFSLYHMSDRFLGEYVEAIHRVPAAYVVGYPSSLHLVGRAMLGAGRPLPVGRLRAVFAAAESLLAFQREIIEEAFGAPVFDRYGTAEIAVSMTQCPQRNLHVDMEFGIVEVEVQEEGDGWERGPLIVTGLANEAMPLLRYRIGDVGTRLTQPCSCGRAGDVFLAVDGRIEDYVVTPDGRRIGRLDHIFKDLRCVAEAQIVQETPAAIELRLVPSESWEATSEAAVLGEVRSRLGEEIRVDIQLVREIPREANGKFRAVKSSVGRLAA